MRHIIPILGGWHTLVLCLVNSFSVFDLEMRCDSHDLRVFFVHHGLGLLFALLSGSVLVLFRLIVDRLLLLLVTLLPYIKHRLAYQVITSSTGWLRVATVRPVLGALFLGGSAGAASSADTFHFF